MFIEAPTTADLQGVIDPERSDMEVHWRSGRWYRRRLDDRFLEIGAGLWASRSLELPWLELDRSR
jgi:hypothetical protein